MRAYRTPAVVAMAGDLCPYLAESAPAFPLIGCPQNLTEPASREEKLHVLSGCPAPCSSRLTRARYAELRPLLQRLSRTHCTSILIFTDTFGTAAGPSTPWLCFARGARAFSVSRNAYVPDSSACSSPRIGREFKNVPLPITNTTSTAQQRRRIRHHLPKSVMFCASNIRDLTVQNP